MRTYMLWFGGPNYSPGTISEDLEEFDTLAACKRAFEARPGDSYYPCVSDEGPEEEGPEGWLWFRQPPFPDEDAYPEAIISFGPRGGVRVSPA